MIVHLVKGIDAHDSVILKAFTDYYKAREWKDNYDGDEDFAFLTITTIDVETD